MQNCVKESSSSWESFVESTSDLLVRILSIFMRWFKYHRAGTTGNYSIYFSLFLTVFMIPFMLSLSSLRRVSNDSHCSLSKLLFADFIIYTYQNVGMLEWQYICTYLCKIRLPTCTWDLNWSIDASSSLLLMASTTHSSTSSFFISNCSAIFAYDKNFIFEPSVHKVSNFILLSTFCWSRLNC